MLPPSSATLRSAAYGGGDQFKRDNLKDSVIRLVAQVTAGDTMRGD
jgi:hypothetical protein